MTDLLFATPWWLPVGVIALGVFVFWNGNRQGNAQTRNIGLGIIAAALLLAAVSYFVDTDRESCVKRTKQFAYNVEKQDWAGLKAMLDMNATLDVNNVGPIYTARDPIVDGAKAAVERYGVKNVRVLSTDSDQTGPIITVQMAVLSDHETAGVGTINTGWQLEWRKMSGQWVITRITNLKIGNSSGDAAAGHFPRPR